MPQDEDRDDTEDETLSEEDLCDALQELFEGAPEFEELGIECPAVREVRSFREAGVMTMDCGFVLRMEDGSEFNITVQRSR